MEIKRNLFGDLMEGMEALERVRKGLLEVKAHMVELAHPVIHAGFYVESGNLVGTRMAPIKSVTKNDDDSFTVLIDHWPTEPSAQSIAVNHLLEQSELAEKEGYKVDAFTLRTAANLLEQMTQRRQRKAKAEAPPEKRNDEWHDLTDFGQIRVGDEISFVLGGKLQNHTVKYVLNNGTPREEVIYDVEKNFYVITAMALNGKSSHKNVRVKKAASK